jgi:hypothetical protein
MVQKYRDPNGIGNSEKFATAAKKPLTGRGGEGRWQELERK